MLHGNVLIIDFPHYLSFVALMMELIKWWDGGLQFLSWSLQSSEMALLDPWKMCVDNLNFLCSNV